MVTIFLMDSVFFLGEGERASFIQQMMQSYGCTYICLWSYDPPSNCLRYTDGFYQQESTNNQPSSSSGTLSQRLFAEYTQSITIVDGRFIPGLAFVSKNPSMDLQLPDLHRMTSSEVQRRFYQETRIKKATFMGFDSGEIELGFSDNSSEVKEIMEMRAWISEYPYRQLMAPTTDQICRTTSSSSSLRSLSYDSPEYSPIPMLFDPATSYLNIPERHEQQQQVMPAQPEDPGMGSDPDHQQVIRSLSQIRNVQLPSIESEEAAMTQAILAVISTTATPSTSLQPPQQNLPPSITQGSSSDSSHGRAFRRYRPPSPSANLGTNRTSSRSNKGQNMIKRSIAFFSSLYSVRRQLMQTQGAGSGGRASSTQLHHMIAERRRREKINDSFQTLRSLLPKGTKKDKASVLASTIEFIKSLINQLGELSTRNQSVEAQKTSARDETSTAGSSSNHPRLEVRLTNVAPSSSSSSSSTTTSRYVDLRVTLRGDFNLGDLTISLLEFLKTDRNASVVSVEANTRVADDASFANNVILRLRIEDEWDEVTFRETIRRVVSDFAEKP